MTINAAGSDELRRTLLTWQNNDGNTALMDVAADGHTETMLAILNAAGSDELRRTMLTQQNNDDNNALMVAAGFGYTETVLALLKAAGSDELRRTLLTWQNNDGRTALMQAAVGGHTETVLALLKAAGDDKKLLTEMLDAVSKGSKNAESLAPRPDIKRALATARASLQQPSAAGRTAAGTAAPSSPALG